MSKSMPAHVVHDCAGQFVSAPAWIRRLRLVSLVCLVVTGCSTVRKAAIHEVGDALAGGGTAFASDDDPEFIRLAAPSNLKMIEALLQETPDHRDLLLAAASGFTQYAYAFIQAEGDRLEFDDIDAAVHHWRRARAMFLRAQAYGLRGLELAHERFTARLQSGPRQAVADVEKDDVPFLYWTACAWGGAISLGKDDPHLIADIPQVEALIDRAYALDPDYEHGAIDQFLIAFEGVRVHEGGDPAERSRHHMDRAVTLSGGDLASPFVSFAETVAVKQQDRDQFEALLRRVLSIDVDRRPEWRLTNLVMQQRARWLLSRADYLFLDSGAPAAKERALP